jgi:hypothetical protein
MGKEGGQEIEGHREHLGRAASECCSRDWGGLMDDRRRVSVGCLDRPELAVTQRTPMCHASVRPNREGLLPLS